MHLPDHGSSSAASLALWLLTLRKSRAALPDVRKVQLLTMGLSRSPLVSSIVAHFLMIHSLHEHVDGDRHVAELFLAWWCRLHIHFRTCCNGATRGRWNVHMRRHCSCRRIIYGRKTGGNMRMLRRVWRYGIIDCRCWWFLLLAVIILLRWKLLLPFHLHKLLSEITLRKFVNVGLVFRLISHMTWRVHLLFCPRSILHHSLVQL